MLSEILFRNLDPNLKAVSLLITSLVYGLSPPCILALNGCSNIKLGNRNS